LQEGVEGVGEVHWGYQLVVLLRDSQMKLFGKALQRVKRRASLCKCSTRRASLCKEEGFLM